MSIGPNDTSRALQLRFPPRYVIYLLVVSAVGGFLALQGLLAFPAFESKINFLLLLTLAVVTQVVATSIPVSDRTGITYALGPAVTLATVPFYGPAAAALVEAVAALALWLVKPADAATWKKSWRQLGFNIGMSSISMFAAGAAFLGAQRLLGAQTIASATLPWLLAATVNDQVNLWLLIGILRLQNGPQVRPLQIWKENAWTVPTGILSVSIGGGLLALALDRFDWLGVLIFFLPVFLSSFTDRLYLRRMQEHMNSLEQVVATRTQELEAAVKQKDAFLAVLAHDMKTPLTTIGLYTQMIRKQPQMVADKPHVVQAILRSQETLTEIVDNIVDLEKLQSDQQAIVHHEDMDLVPVLEYLLEGISAQAEDKNIALRFDTEVNSLPLRADRQQVERIVNNLLSNAIKYTPAGGDVELSVRASGEHAVVQVKDTGFGIPADELPHIFEPYRRVKKHKDKAGGTGLGLAISKALVEAHHGTIAVVSEEDVGSTFTVTLPRHAPV